MARAGRRYQRRLGGSLSDLRNDDGGNASEPGAAALSVIPPGRDPEADALIAEADAQRWAQLRGAGAEPDAADDDDDDEAEPPAEGMDLHDLLEALGTHLHEHLDTILRWPWKVFCRKWARLLDWLAAEEERKEQERIEREYEQLRQGMGQHAGM